jgi:hypothetical protein
MLAATPNTLNMPVAKACRLELASRVPFGPGDELRVVTAKGILHWHRWATDANLNNN